MKWASFFRRHRLLWIFGATLGIVGVFEIAWLIRFGNTPQVYTDVVLEQLGSEFSNKSIELALYWIGMALGLLVIGILLVRGWKKGISGEKDERSGMELFLVGFLVLLAGKYIFYGTFQPLLLLAVILLLYAALLRREYLGEILCCYFLTIYAVTGIYRIFVLLGGGEALNATAVAIFAFAFTLVTCGALSRGGHQETSSRPSIFRAIPSPGISDGSL